MSNIAEGFEGYGYREFHQFLSMAKASCAEIRSQLYVALDSGYLDKNNFQKLLNQALEVGKIIGGLRSSVTKQRRTDKTKVLRNEQ